jgi:DNA-binding GntR family transcriptional regulator
MSQSLQQVTERLEEDIVFGRRRPRERLVEEDLVAQFGAKKHVIRQALVELERMGLVERKRNKGAMVRDYTPRDVEQIFAVRELLEAEAARQIPLPAPPEVVAELKALFEVHSAATEAGDLRTAFRSNIRFHQCLFRACGNAYLAEAIDAAAFRAHGVRFYSLAKPDLLRQARDDHAGMIECLASGDRQRLVELCVRHLKPTVKAYGDAYEQVLGSAYLRQSA